jgi:DNA polymerase type B, organellar and viral
MPKNKSLADRDREFKEFLVKHVYEAEIGEDNPQAESFDWEPSSEDASTLDIQDADSPLYQRGYHFIVCASCGELRIANRAGQTLCAVCALSKDRHKPGTHKSGAHTDRIAAADRIFIGIDGEGAGENEHGQQTYLLMCASDREGNQCQPPLFRDNQPLSTKECLEFILSLPAKAFIMGYGFDYDITHILHDLPPYVMERLLRGKDNYDEEMRAAPGVKNYTHWEGYALLYMPKKHLIVARSSIAKNEDGFLEPTVKKRPFDTRRTVHEAIGFFQCAFVKAITDWTIGTPEQRQMVAENKQLRPVFETITDNEIEYCKTECWMLAELMHQYWDAAIACGHKLQEETGLPLEVRPDIPEGAGCCASKLHKTAGTAKRLDPRKRHKMQRAAESAGEQPDFSAFLPVLPADIEAMGQCAYYGGRFEITRTGRVKGPIYEYDINSAYPTAMLALHCSRAYKDGSPHTRWEKVRERPRDGSLYLADITFDHPATNLLNAFPFRTPKHHIIFPAMGRGVYWSVEIEDAEQLFNAKIETHSCWRAVKTCDCHPYSWLPIAYAARKELADPAKGGNKAKGVPLKLAYNSLYGKLAQRIGAAPFQDMLSAGLITAITRATLLKAAAQAPDAIVYLATDGIYSTRQLDLTVGDELGQFEHDPKKHVHGDMFIVKPGFYWFGDEIAKPKTRGVPQSVVAEYAPQFEAAWDKFIPGAIWIGRNSSKTS